MKKTGIIPLRAGSKSIIHKNRKRLLGRPLFTWVLAEAIFSDLDEVYVFTDDPIIMRFVQNEYSWTKKVKVLQRSSVNAQDTSSTEAAMMEFSKKVKHNYDILCLLQATSPLTTAADINAALNTVSKGKKYDSCLSVVQTKRFIWNPRGESINYKYQERPRRQDFDGLLVENGAVYVTTRTQFLSSGIRIGGKIGLIKMPEVTLTEIDEPSDWIIAQHLVTDRLKTLKGKSQKIKWLVLDVDGVFTDGTVNYSADGEFSKRFSMRDGMGLELLAEEGVGIMVMTSEKSQLVEKRMKKLSLELFQGVKDKYARLQDILTQRSIKRSEVCYIGDDVNDLANLCASGWGICPQNAINEVKTQSDLVLSNQSGVLAIREAVDFITNYNKRFTNE